MPKTPEVIITQTTHNVVTIAVNYGDGQRVVAGTGLEPTADAELTPKKKRPFWSVVLRALARLLPW